MMLSVDTGTVITVTLTVFGVLAAVLILHHELRMRRRIAAEELALQRRRFEREDRESDARQQWLERQNVTLGEMVKPLAEKLAASLVADTRWAAEALERAKLGPYTKTLFGERSSHFREEKEHIAERFVPMLLRRCRKLIEQDGKRVFLLIDSGTTLYSFFSRLGEQTVRAWEMGDRWFRDGRLVVITNNLPGIQLLMETGRPNPANRYSDLALDCRLLPGVPLPVYSAVTGAETEEAIMRIRSDSGPSVAIISLVTGNWIRIRQTSPRCPIPLARGKGHLKAKQTFVNVANEVYVIGPLGKIFASASREAVNKWLGFDSAQVDLEKQSYEELTITRDDEVKKIALISTSRTNRRILNNLSIYLRGQLGVEVIIDEDAFTTRPLGEPASILFAFDNLPNETSLEREVEFPHRHTRRNDFIEFFSNP